MEFKNANHLAIALMNEAGEIRRYWRTNSGALSDAGKEYSDFLASCADKVAAWGDYISWQKYEEICQGDDFDHALYVWEEVPELEY